MRSAATAKRTEAAVAPAELDAHGTAKALTKTLADPDPNVRAAAAFALAGLRDPGSIVALAGIVAEWNTPELAQSRRAALHALMEFRNQEAAVELARVLAGRIHSTPLGLEEHSALLAVTYAEKAGCAAPRVVRALTALLAHKDQHVAERAASLLMLFPAESHGPLARSLRTAAAPEVRCRAALALGACRHGLAVEALVSCARRPGAQCSGWSRPLAGQHARPGHRGRARSRGQRPGRARPRSRPVGPA